MWEHYIKHYLIHTLCQTILASKIPKQEFSTKPKSGIKTPDFQTRIFYKTNVEHQDSSFFSIKHISSSKSKAFMLVYELFLAQTIPDGDPCLCS